MVGEGARGDVLSIAYASDGQHQDAGSKMIHAAPNTTSLITSKSVSKNGVVIIGSPSLQSQTYASKGSKEGHVNCKDGKELKRVMEQHFENVFLFSMNDEVVHTGFHPMAHYLITLCAGRKY